MTEFITNDPPRSVVITGCGWVTPFAIGGIYEVIDALHSRSSAAAPKGTVPFHAVPDSFLDTFPSIPKELRQDRGAWMTAAACETALAQAALDRSTLDPTRIGLVLGCALAGQLGMVRFACDVREQSPRFVTPINFPQTVGNFIAGAMARGYDLRGPNSTLAGGSASGLDAVIEACSLLSSGQADVMLAGGTEELNASLAEALSKSSVVGRTADALPLSEGACWFVLERADFAKQRGARPMASANSWHQSEDDVSAQPASTGSIVSIAGFSSSGAIRVERWTGRCLAAVGPAAIAAMNGQPVPLDGGRIHQFSLTGKPPASRIIARGEHTHDSMFELLMGS